MGHTVPLRRRSSQARRRERISEEYDSEKIPTDELLQSLSWLLRNHPRRLARIRRRHLDFRQGVLREMRRASREIDQILTAPGEPVDTEEEWTVVLEARP